MCDPTFANDTKRIDEIPSKEFADTIVKNITDVSMSILRRIYRPIQLALYQDRTHTPDYYNPEYDAKMDHGTVRPLIVFL